VLSPIRIQTALGDDVAFMCTLKGDVTWFHERYPITGDSNLVSNSSNDYRLLIKNVEARDEGRYTCQGLDSAGNLIAQWGILLIYGKQKL